MTCVKAQSMITPFIRNELKIKELEEFLDHIGSCTKCKEELEYYYVLLTAMRQLEEDKDLSDDYHTALTTKIRRAEDRILHVKYTYYRKKAILILVMILLAFLLGIRYSDKSNEFGNTEKSNQLPSIRSQLELNNEPQPSGANKY